MFDVCKLREENVKIKVQIQRKYERRVKKASERGDKWNTRKLYLFTLSFSFSHSLFPYFFQYITHFPWRKTLWGHSKGKTAMRNGAKSFINGAARTPRAPAASWGGTARARQKQCLPVPTAPWALLAPVLNLVVSLISHSCHSASIFFPSESREISLGRSMSVPRGHWP